MMETKTSKSKANLCLNCGKECDSATSIDHKNRPKPGNVAICLDCGHVMIYTKKLQFRELNEVEFFDVHAHPTVRKIQEARGYVIRKMGKPN
jgi:transcription elongation factor Elf1